MKFCVCVPRNLWITERLSKLDVEDCEYQTVAWFEQNSVLCKMEFKTNALTYCYVGGL